MDIPYKFNRTHVLITYNQKGGVSKTSSVIGIGSCLAKQGYRVIHIDCDPQKNLTLFYEQSVQSQGFTGTIKDYIDAGGSISAKDLLRTFTFVRTPGSGKQKDFYYTIEESAIENIPAPENAKPATRSCTMSMIPGDPNIALVNLESPDIVQKLVSELVGDETERTIIIVDCPPAITSPINIALYMGTELLVPVTPASDAVAGIPTTLSVLNQVRAAGFPLKLIGLYISNLDARESVPKEIATAVRESLKETSIPVLNSVIRHSSSCEKSRALGVPAATLEFMQPYVVDLTLLSNEIIKRIREIEEEEMS